MPTSDILYRPVSPPQDVREVPRYLDDELTRIGNSIELLNTRMVNGLPWKGFYCLLTGGTLPTNFSCTQLYNLNAPARLGVGLYQFTLNYPVVQGVQVIDRCFPSITPQILTVNHPVDTHVFFTDLVVVNAVTGVFTIQLWGGYVPASGKLTLVAYDLQNADKLFVSGDFSLGGNAAVVASILNELLAGGG